MNQRIKVPAGYSSVSLQDFLPKEGEHVVRIESFEQEFGDDVHRVRFSFLDGNSRGLQCTERYDLSESNEKRSLALWAFKQLLEAVGVRPENGELDLDAAIGQELVVRVVHSSSKSTGRVFANVRDPRPNF